jgi:hypothetical protein
MSRANGVKFCRHTSSLFVIEVMCEGRSSRLQGCRNFGWNAPKRKSTVFKSVPALVIDGTLAGCCAERGLVWRDVFA